MTHRHPGEIRLRTSVLLEQPATSVADLLLDWDHDHLWRRHVRSFTCVPPGRAVTGQLLVERLSLAGLTFTTSTRVTRADATSASYEGTSASVAVHGTRTVVSLDGGGSRFTSETVVRPLGALRLLAPVLTDTYRRADEADVLGLPELLPRLLSSTHRTTHQNQETTR